MGRRPRVTAAAVSLALLVMIETTSPLAHDVTRTWWANIIVLAFIAYSAAATWYFCRRPLPAEPAKVAGFFLAMAMSPAVVATGALFLGASPWSAWAALAASIGLISWWAWTRDKNRWEPPPTRFDRWLERHRKPLCAFAIIGIVWSAVSLVQFTVTRHFDSALSGAVTAFGTFGLILLATREASGHVHHWDAEQLNGAR